MDESLGEVVQQFGVWAYVALFVATFVKTGLIYVPMVPTTTLLFAAGVLASPQVKGLNPVTSLAVLLVAAVLGDFANYGWGRIFGERLAKAPCAKRLKLDQITKAEEAFERYGLNTFLLARWVSVLRSTVPFVAGSSRYSATKFLLLNSVACLLWVGVIFGAGYVLGESNQVRSLMGIIAGSILVFVPALSSYVVPRVLGGGKNLMVGNLIELQFGQGRNWPLGAALSVTLVIIVLFAMLYYVRNASKSGGSAHG